MFTPDLLARAQALVAAMAARGLTVATAESCTGGLVAGLLTEVPGSSAVLERGFVTYSNAAKHEMLGVPTALIEAHGAVSEPVAQAMAEGALARSAATLAVSITGVAGPGGGSADKPVGLVCFGFAHQGAPIATATHCFGPLARSAIRLASVEVAIAWLEGQARA